MDIAVKNRWFVIWAGTVWLFGLSCLPLAAQVPLSAGTYANNFDSLGAASAGWTNNLTLPGWYASKGDGDATNILAGTGSGTTGSIYSYGVNGSHPAADRALGSLAGSAIPYAYGLRFTNDTALPRSNITVSFTGEQWRTGSTNSPQMLAFTWRVADIPCTNAHSGGSWSNFPALDFVSPNLTADTAALDGNAATNRQIFSSIVLTGVVVDPGQELFLRWLDVDDGGSDNALAIDDVTVSSSAVAARPPFFITQPQSQLAYAGGDATFIVEAGGTKPLHYQWQFAGTNLSGATDSSLSLLNVTAAQNGDYLVVVTNAVGATNSQVATLIVQAPPVAGFSLLTYNVAGNGATDWSTNAPQVQAIARILQHLTPDIITFNEIPFSLRYEMTNFTAAFLPGFQVALSSGTDGSIVSAIASRFPITRSNKWLDGIDLRSFGYSNADNALDNFTRDLYEAEIAVPGFPRRLHVFTTHLKSSDPDYTEGALKRAAEAAAITNWFATNFFVHYPYDPYTLSGDMNEADTNQLSIQRLLSSTVDLHLTNPTNPVTGRINTFSTTTVNPSSRIDYIFPGGLLASNIASSQVFRSMVLTNPAPPPPLLTNDEKTASDHLPVMMVFNNPYDKPFRITSLTRSNTNLTLEWESVFGQPYRVDASANLIAWEVLASNLVAASNRFTFATNVTAEERFLRVYRVP